MFELSNIIPKLTIIEKVAKMYTVFLLNNTSLSIPLGISKRNMARYKISCRARILGGWALNVSNKKIIRIACGRVLAISKKNKEVR